ncbi:arginine/serine-rich protein 1 [Equus caballus]|uniref:arginine/serine-rich protein 1 n=1 Tax=Equus caballus TaxID=9796 RepID=UPI0038B341E7
MVYPKEHSSWRKRSRKRSLSRSSFRLSGKDKMELLEIAKASTATSLGTANLDLPVGLRMVPVVKERNCGTAVPNIAKFEMEGHMRLDYGEMEGDGLPRHTPTR